MMVESKAQALQLPQGPVDDALAHFVSETDLESFVLGLDEPHQPLKIGVAYSGGADSTALLLSALRKWSHQVHALHIHHGLQDAAEDFMNHCEQRCAQWEIPFSAMRVHARHASGESPEDAARKSRYQALVNMAKAHGLNLVLLGQHADDQIETLLLALSRGAGLPGLSSMPRVFQLDGVWFARPMLSVGADALRAYLSEQGVSWIEDPTNQECIYTRNRIRLDLLPAIATTFPEYKTTFLRSIRHIVQAQALLEELAQDDFLKVGNPPVIAAVQKLSEERQVNVLRFWLKTQYQTSPSAKQLQELLKQIKACQTRGHHIHLRVGHGAVERKESGLHYCKKE